MTSLLDSTIAVYLIRTLQIVCVLGSIILVHEFGHFIVAKKCGMTVDEFAVGIGPTLRKWDRGGTTYRIGLFLFMGYVRIRGLEGGDPVMPEPASSDAPEEAAEADREQPLPGAPVEPPVTAEDDPGSFYSRPIPHRVAALLAGAGMNIAFAAFLFCALYGFWGVPVPPDTRIEAVAPGSAAEAAGIEAGWKIASVDGAPTARPSDVQDAVAESEGQPLQMKLTNRGQERTVAVTPRPKEDGEGWLVGVTFSDDSVSDVVQRVDPGRPAAKAGIEAGDRIVAVDGEPVTEPATIRYALAAVPEELELKKPDQVVLPPIKLTIERDGERRGVEVHPEAKKRQRAKADDAPRGGTVEDYLVGDTGLALRIRYQKLGWGEAVKYGFMDSRDILINVFQSLAELLRGQQLDQVGGPVMIVKALSEQAFYGWYALLSWAGMLSIMIGVFNLLPLPALDGGRVLFVLIEPVSGWLLGRCGVDDAKPKIRRVEGWIHAVGLLALLALMVLVSVRDVGRW